MPFRIPRPAVFALALGAAFAAPAGLRAEVCPGFSTATVRGDLAALFPGAALTRSDRGDSVTLPASGDRLNVGFTDVRRQMTALADRRLAGADRARAQAWIDGLKADGTALVTDVSVTPKTPASLRALNARYGRPDREEPDGEPYAVSVWDRGLHAVHEVGKDAVETVSYTLTERERAAALVALFARQGLDVSDRAVGNDWTLVPGVRAGPIRGGWTEPQVTAAIGRGQTREEETLWNGLTMRIIRVYPETPYQLWLTLSSSGIVTGARTMPHGGRMDNPPIRWNLGGIELGAALTDLEKANGRPFLIRLSDFSSAVSDWQGGALAGSTVFLAPAGGRRVDDPRVRTGAPAPSDDPLVRKMELRVTALGVELRPTGALNSVPRELPCAP